jgi:hypothetical protein
MKNLITMLFALFLVSSAFAQIKSPQAAQPTTPLRVQTQTAPLSERYAVLGDSSRSIFSQSRSAAPAQTQPRMNTQSAAPVLIGVMNQDDGWVAIFELNTQIAYRKIGEAAPWNGKTIASIALDKITFTDDTSVSVGNNLRNEAGYKLGETRMPRGRGNVPSTMPFNPTTMPFGSGSFPNFGGMGRGNRPNVGGN